MIACPHHRLQQSRPRSFCFRQSLDIYLHQQHHKHRHCHQTKNRAFYINRMIKLVRVQFMIHNNEIYRNAPLAPPVPTCHHWAPALDRHDCSSSWEIACWCYHFRQPSYSLQVYFPIYAPICITRLRDRGLDQPLWLSHRDWLQFIEFWII